MFSIVETIENENKIYTAVPKQWVNDSVLYWPKHLKECEISKLLKNPNTIPEKNWCSISCECKASANSYLEARKLEKLYSTFSDTETEERYFHESATNPRKRIKKSVTVTNIKDYNSEINALKRISKDAPTIIMQSQNDDEQIQNSQNGQNIFQNISNIENRSPNLIEVPYSEEVILQNKLPENVRYEIGMAPEGNVSVLSVPSFDQTLFLGSDLEIRNSIEKIQKQIELIKDNQTTLNIKVDKILKILMDKSEDTEKEFHIMLTENVEFPLKTIDQMEELNKLLSDADFAKEMVHRLTKIGGTSRVADGCKIMYKLTDFMFDAELLTKFSWTGSSKLLSKKEAFFKLTCIVELIFDVIIKADCRHSRTRNEFFLKEKILKHANQRFNRINKNLKEKDGGSFEQS